MTRFVVFTSDGIANEQAISRRRGSWLSGRGHRWAGIKPGPSADTARLEGPGSRVQSDPTLPSTLPASGAPRTPRNLRNISPSSVRLRGTLRRRPSVRRNPSPVRLGNRPLFAFWKPRSRFVTLASTPSSRGMILRHGEKLFPRSFGIHRGGVEGGENTAPDPNGVPVKSHSVKDTPYSSEILLRT